MKHDKHRAYPPHDFQRFKDFTSIVFKPISTNLLHHSVHDSSHVVLLYNVVPTGIAGASQRFMFLWNHIACIRRLHTIHQVTHPSLEPWIAILTSTIHMREKVLVLAYIDVFIGAQVNHAQLSVIHPHAPDGQETYSNFQAQRHDHPWQCGVFCLVSSAVHDQGNDKAENTNRG